MEETDNLLGDQGGSINHHTKAESESEEKGLSMWEGVFAVLSTYLGAGIVFVPYSFMTNGFPMTLVIMACVATFLHCSTCMWLNVLDMLPVDVNSIYDLGYTVSKNRFVIYLIAAMLVFNCGGLTIIYLILFSDVSASIVNQSVPKAEGTILATRGIYVILVVILLSPLFFKKKLSELKIVSLLLGLMYGLFVATFIFQLCTLGTQYNPDYPTTNTTRTILTQVQVSEPAKTLTHATNYFDFKFQWTLISCTAVIFNSLLIVVNMFPLYASFTGTAGERR